jgi:deoxyribodipyrimidine photolyase-related protein
MPAEKNAPSNVRIGLILGDQLDHQSPVLQSLSPHTDQLVMIEAGGEAKHVWSHQARIALFLSAMRHHAASLREAGWRLDYLSAPGALADALGKFLSDLKQQVAGRGAIPEMELLVVEPGEWRVLQDLQSVAHAQGVALTVLTDTHFLCTREAFAKWAGTSKSLRMEFFYRQMRKQHQVLMQADGEPQGGRWNFDTENRKGFPKGGPGKIAPPAQFAPDAITREVLAEVAQKYGEHPGRLEDFAWAVTRDQALQALHQFVDTRLAHFGEYQDAMWRGEAFGWHALLSTSLNLKLLHPREVIDVALKGWRDQALPLASVEGFIRQVLGWREFIRGVYWLDMPKLREDNFYQHKRALPQWYWSGETQMACMRETVGQTLRYGYAHHIQRLMVTGNFALLAEVLPQQVEDWYLAVYVDAIEWVELPNTAGMALFANGGRFTSKPYVASGAYIKRMSNYCTGCKYRPEERVGPRACPVTTLYWNFLDKHCAEFAGNPRTVLMVRNLEKMDDAQRQAVREHAAQLLDNLDGL